jgi:5-methylcytosine-specific restriction enzyme subunit McrC
MTTVRISLNEWETAGPARGSPLEGQNLERDPAGRTLAESLTALHQLEVLELARGLEVRATSFVGRVRVGQVEVTVHPKITGTPLLNLFRYAYGLRDLHLHGGASYSAARGSFQDLIIQQLGDEVQELLTRGLHRDYVPITEDLHSPRGRIDFTRFLRAPHAGQSSLPCIHHPRSEDTLVNQVLHAGVLLASHLAADLDLRVRMQRLSKMLRISATEVDLDEPRLREAWLSLDRRTKAYESSLRLIELLLGAAGVSLSSESARLKLHGFLFDMNRFFQALLSRFLGEHLPGWEVRDERRLKGMFIYDPLQNPQNRKAPTPRPDFVITRGPRIASVLDAKYRDLWEKPLPPSMLYQLAVYALGHDRADRRAAIVYPTLNVRAVDQSITIQEAVKGALQARVDLRPVNLLVLNKLLQTGSGLAAQRLRVEFARCLAFGERPPD